VTRNFAVIAKVHVWPVQPDRNRSGPRPPSSAAKPEAKAKAKQRNLPTAKAKQKTPPPKRQSPEAAEARASAPAPTSQRAPKINSAGQAAARSLRPTRSAPKHMAQSQRKSRKKDRRRIGACGPGL